MILLAVVCGACLFHLVQMLIAHPSSSACSRATLLSYIRHSSRGTHLVLCTSAFRFASTASPPSRASDLGPQGHDLVLLPCPHTFVAFSLLLSLAFCHPSPFLHGPWLWRHRGCVFSWLDGVCSLSVVCYYYYYYLPLLFVCLHLPSQRATCLPALHSEVGRIMTTYHCERLCGIRMVRDTILYLNWS